MRLVCIIKLPPHPGEYLLTIRGPFAVSLQGLNVYVLVFDLQFSITQSSFNKY